MKKWLAWGVGALVLVLAALLAAALVFIDTPAVQAELQRRLSETLGGKVTWEALEISILPAPHGGLRQVRVEIPEKLSASVEDLNVYLRFWPLFRGSVEISSVSVVRPQVRVIPSKESASDAPVDPLALYRAVAEPAARALRDFAPDMTFKLEQAGVEVGDFALRDLRADARTGDTGIDLQLSAGSKLWQQLSIGARVEYADLSARADVALDALALDKDIPAADVRAKLRTDANSAIECDFDARLGAVATAKGKLFLPAGKPPQLAADIDGVDVAQAIAIARAKAPGLDVIESAEGRLSAKVDFTLGKPWQLGLDVVNSDAAVKLAPLPWKISAQAGRVTINPESLHVSGARGSVGASTFADVAAQVDFGKSARLSSASGNATLVLEQWFPWLQTKVPLKDITALSGRVDVALSRLALRFDDPKRIDFDATATPRTVSAALKMLPAAVSADGGLVRVSPKAARLEKVDGAMLDARTAVSGTVGIEKPAIELALADGFAGEKLARWALERGQVPARLEPKTPLRFAAQRIAWTPKGGLQADARVDFDRGPALGVALALQPEVLELRRVAIKDAGSDAVASATVAGGLIQACFSGTLQGRSIAAMLRQPPPSGSGSVRGELRATIDQKQPQRTLAEGKLVVEALDLTWLAGRKVVIERADMTAEPAGMRIIEARFGVEDQFFDVRGESKRTDAGPVVEGRIESAGVMLDRLLPPVDPNAPKKEASPIWPLPVTGKIELDTGFVQYKEYRIEPFAGILTLEHERARLEVQQARMCGVSFPMEVEAHPEETIAEAHIQMKNEPLERTVQCLTGGGVQLTGNADLTAELRVQGRRPHLLRSLTGTAQTVVRDGRVQKFAFLGNILSYRGLAGLDRKSVV